MLEKLLAELKDETSLPIRIERIAVWMEQNNAADVIEFYEVDVDKRALRGVFVRYEESTAVYGELSTIVRIGYSAGLNDCWRRVVCCKELMHAFDGSDYRVTNAADLSRLTSGLLVPGAAATLSDASKKTLEADQVALVKALLVLVPLEVAKQLREAYAANRLGLMDIAQSLRIPLEYTGFVLSDDFAEAHAVCCK